MDCDHTQVSRVAIFRTLKTECKASRTHQAIGIIKAVRGAVRERQIVSIDNKLTQPAVRYTRISRGQNANRIRQSSHNVTHRSLLVAINRHVGLSRTKTSNNVNKLSVVIHRKAVSGETVDIHVSTTALVVSIALRVQDCHAKARGIRRWNGINTYLNGVKSLSKPL